jgi:DNA invertase Pin-like site-specific DNA recombinase
MRLIGYIRVSRVGGREGESFISPPVQRERITAAATGGGHTLVDVLEDLDQPGSKYQRPGFQEALRRVEAGEADGMIVAKLDRFARSVSGAAQALERLEQAGGSLIAVDLGMDTSTSAGRLMRNVLMSLAEFELDRIREGWAATREHTIGRGVHISNVPPFGYERDPDGRLRPNAATAPHVRELFLRRAAGDSWRDLAALLDEKAPRERGSWPVTTLNRMIANRAYLGEAYAGGIVNREAHEPLVSAVEWHAAQGVRQLGRRRNGEGALLAGLIRCASCGRTMTRTADGRRGYLNYSCSGRRASGICSARVKISTQRADTFVERSFLEWLAEHEPATLSGAAASDELEQDQARLEGAELELAAYRDASAISIIGKQAYLEGLTGRVRQVQEAQDALASRHVAASSGLRRVTLEEEWPQMTVAERRTILGAALDHVEVRRAAKRGQGATAEERLVLVWRELALLE